MDMYDYFTNCAANAAPNSTARETYSGYTRTLADVVQMIKERLREEDDGK
jgi:hypothetical protein